MGIVEIITLIVFTLTFLGILAFLVFLVVEPKIKIVIKSPPPNNDWE